METPSSPQAWHEEWFDSPHYHQLYGHRSDAEAQAFVQAMHKQWGWQHCDVLDLACGKGRHARAAAQLGHNVVGLDLSHNSIAAAKERAGGLPNLTFVEGDMRSFDLGQTFDGVLNLFTSFGYFDRADDHTAVLGSITRHLRPGGFLVLDFLDVAFTKKHLSPSDTITREGVEYAITRELKPGTNGGWDTFVKRIRHRDSEDVQEHVEKVAALTNPQLSGLIQSAGFDILERFGNYALDPWAEGQTPRLIIHAKKK